MDQTKKTAGIGIETSFDIKYFILDQKLLTKFSWKMMVWLTP